MLPVLRRIFPNVSDSNPWHKHHVRRAVYDYLLHLHRMSTTDLLSNPLRVAFARWRLAL